MLAGTDEISIDTLTDIDGVGICGIVLANMSTDVTYKVSITPQWVDTNGETVVGAAHVGTFKISAAE